MPGTTTVSAFKLSKRPIILRQTGREINDAAADDHDHGSHYHGLGMHDLDAAIVTQQHNHMIRTRASTSNDQCIIRRSTRSSLRLPQYLDCLSEPAYRRACHTGGHTIRSVILPWRMPTCTLSYSRLHTDSGFRASSSRARKARERARVTLALVKRMLR